MEQSPSSFDAETNIRLCFSIAFWPVWSRRGVEQLEFLHAFHKLSAVVTADTLGFTVPEELSEALDAVSPAFGLR